MELEIDMLPNEMISRILWYIPLIKRQELRRVCRRWRDNIDGHWSQIRELTMHHSEEHSIADSGARLYVLTVRPAMAEEMIYRSSRYLRSLKYTHGLYCECPAPDNVVYCENLEELWLKSNVSIEQLSYLLCQNRNLKRLNVLCSKGTQLCECSGAVSGSRLEEVRITEPFRLSPLLLKLVKDIIRGADSLKSLESDQVDGEVFELLGGKVQLEKLDLSISGGIDSSSLSETFKLKNLKYLRIDTPRCSSGSYFTDDFITGVVQNCQLLETLILLDNADITNDSILALSTLPNLRDLRIWFAHRITDMCLKYLCNLDTLCLVFCSEVCDTGVIELLRMAQQLTLRFLDLHGTSVTKEVISVANEVVRGRLSIVPLDLSVSGAGVKGFQLENQSSFLTVWGQK